MVYKHADAECASVMSTPLLCVFVPASPISRGAGVVSVVLVFCGGGRDHLCLSITDYY